MHQPPHSAEYNAPRINVNRAHLKNVETFAYLGRTLSRNTRIDDKVVQRISKTSQSLGWLQASMWNRHNIRLNTKLEMYKVVLTTSLYGTETWTVYSNQAKWTTSDYPNDFSTTTPTTDNSFIDAPPPMSTGSILPIAPPSPITAKNTNCPTPTTSVATSEYLPPATYNTTAPVPAMGTR
ncbi:unnamed protein product [Schistocephalus solidus]|uniref:Uncharacterized protein n=1 Tax=Schistocephalus solidus TaxID=70667 RepID=A0A183TC38_SCHSO|nr:unnamed protein product [Schistocephalus solidus]